MNKFFSHAIVCAFLIATIVFLNACSTDNDPEPEPDPEVPSNKTPFLKKAGGTSDDYIHASITDDKGNLYVTGSFKETATFGNTPVGTQGGVDAFVAKYNTNGDLLWIVPIGGTQYSSGRALAFDKTGNVCVVGEFNGTITFAGTTLTAYGQYNTFIATFSKAGALLSSKKDGIGGPNSGTSGLTWPRAIAFDNDGNMYMTGSFYAEVKFGDVTLTGNAEIDGQMFVMKYNADGSVDWVNKSSAAASARGIAVSSSNIVYVTGNLWGTSSFGNIQLTSKGFGDALLVGFETEDGDVNSAQNYGGINEDGGMDLAFDQQGQLYLMGYFSGSVTFGKYTLNSGTTSDMFLFRVGTGSYNWTRKLGGNCSVSDLLINSTGIYVTGWFMDGITFGSTNVTSQGSLDAFVAKYNFGGAIVWHATAGGTSNDRGESIAIDALGNVFMTGDFQSTINANGKSVASSGSTDAMIVKFPTN